MSHYFEKTIVDAKDIYTNYLINILSPLFYHGLKSMYDKAIEIEKKYIDAEKRDPNLKNPGSIVLFQHFLMELEKISDSHLEEETKRFRDTSGCADIFDDLIRAVIKSNIIVLTYTASNKSCKIIKEKFHEKIDPKTFIHKCYLECVKIFFDHPMLFYHKFTQGELKENQRLIYQLIKVCIKNAINKCLPMKDILFEYLNNDYIDEEQDEYLNVKDMLRRDMTKHTDDGGIMKILDSESSSVRDTKVEVRNIDDITALVYNRKIDDTLDGCTFTEKNSNVSDEIENLNIINDDNNIKNNIDKIISGGMSNKVSSNKKELEKIMSDKKEDVDIIGKMGIKTGMGKSKDLILQNAIINAKKETELKQNIESEKNQVNVVKTNIDADVENHFGEEFE